MKKFRFDAEASDDDAMADVPTWVTVLVFIVAVVGSSTFGGFVFAKLWLWFVVPLGVPAIGMWHAAGLASFVHYATATISPSKAEKRSAAKRAAIALGYVFVGGSVALVAGYVDHLLMMSL